MSDEYICQSIYVRRNTVSSYIHPTDLRNEERFPSLSPLFRDHGEDLVVLLTTNASSAKVAEVRANPAVENKSASPDEKGY